MEDHLKKLEQFFVAGINYKKSDAAVRGLFALGSEQYQVVLESAKAQGISELFVLSTCNRTEIYGFAPSADHLIQLLCAQTAGPADVFKAAAYIKQGHAAIAHVFHVGAGLDSQILGDYEIVGQLKTAVKFAKQNGCIGTFTERLINSVLQSSKLIKNTTALSGGTVSVSFAAIQYIRNYVTGLKDKKILIVGTGKMGRIACHNIIDYLNTKNVTLINRSPEKAEALARDLGLRSAPLENIAEEAGKANIILIATNSLEPVVLKKHIEGSGDKLIIDLSVPFNIEKDACTLPGVKVVSVDELSKLKDETLKMREAEVPKAKVILHQVMNEFEEWYQMRRHVPMLKGLKVMLTQLNGHPRFIDTTTTGVPSENRIQKVINETAGKIKVDNQHGCQFISALHQFISANN